MSEIFSDFAGFGKLGLKGVAENQKGFGFGNDTVWFGKRRILDNLEKLAGRRDVSLMVRLPLIPGIDDSDGNIKATAQFCRKTGIKEIHVLSYHPLGIPKYQQLGREYTLHGTPGPSQTSLQELKEIIEAEGMEGIIE
ncbi:MAG: hypothetical protein RDV48_11650 [Candidatus Eremiobacteraeota bacterium]|nr:hypothetical protein [Candidatus Eremiobacteraeota bacterium]